MGRFLAQVSRSQVRDHDPRREVEAGIPDRRAYAFPALADRRFVKTDDVNLWRAVADVHFDGDAAGIDARE